MQQEQPSVPSGRFHCQPHYFLLLLYSGQQNFCSKICTCIYPNIRPNTGCLELECRELDLQFCHKVYLNFTYQLGRLLVTKCPLTCVLKWSGHSEFVLSEPCLSKLLYLERWSPLQPFSFQKKQATVLSPFCGTCVYQAIMTNNKFDDSCQTYSPDTKHCQ